MPFWIAGLEVKNNISQMTLQLAVVGVICTSPTTCAHERLEGGAACSEGPSVASVSGHRRGVQAAGGAASTRKGSSVNVMAAAAPLSASSGV